MTGLRSCYLLKPSHPECGGVCTNDYPLEPLPPCGDGHDVASVTDFDASVEPADAGGVVVPFDDADEDAVDGGALGPPPRVRYGCTCGVGSSASWERLGLLILAAAVLVSRRRSWRR